MSQFFVGSINLTKLIENAKKGHSSFAKSSKDGNVYVNIQVWSNDEPNEFGQHMSLLLNSTKELKEQEGKVYFGNAKKLDSSQPVKNGDIDSNWDANVPTRQAKDNSDKTFTDNQADDLPF